MSRGVLRNGGIGNAIDLKVLEKPRVSALGNQPPETSGDDEKLTPTRIGEGRNIHWCWWRTTSTVLCQPAPPPEEGGRSRSFNNSLWVRKPGY